MQLLRLTFVAFLSLTALSTAYAAPSQPETTPAKQLPASKPIKQKHHYGAVAVGVTNAENFGHHWSAVGVSSRSANWQTAREKALSQCNSKANKLRPEDGCMILNTWDSAANPKTCTFAMPAKLENRAFTIVRTSANEVWRACKEVGALFCKPQDIVGGCTK